MKNTKIYGQRIFILLALLAIVTLNAQLSNIFAQGTAFTYQGRLNTGGTPANGLYDFRFKLALDPLGDNYAGNPFLTNSIFVTNGLFITSVDFGAAVFTGANYWLEVDVRTNNPANTLGYTSLAPLQVLNSTPYAVLAATANTAYQLNGTLPASQLGDDPVFSGIVFGSSFSDTNGQFIAGEDNTIQAGGDSSAIGGGSGNNIGTNGDGSTIGGGINNYILADDITSFIGGGYDNQISSFSYDTSYIEANVIVGGVGNFIGTNVTYAFIGCGSDNKIDNSSALYGSEASIVGGNQNFIGSGAGGAFIGGGALNQIGTNPPNYYFDAVIVGGNNNTISYNTEGAVIGGGEDNIISNGTASVAYDATIGGGQYNKIGANSDHTSIGGGGGNQIENSSSFSTVSGGQDNLIESNQYAAFIGGGSQNQIDYGSPGSGYSAILGGQYNAIGTNVSYSTIGGGDGNNVQASAQSSVIPGGSGNVVGGSESFAAGASAFATNNNSFVWSDGSAPTASTVNNSVTFRAGNGYRFFTGGGGATLAAGATSWTTLSDRNAKKNFQPVDTVAVLNKLAAIPIQQWNYKWEKDGEVPNIGPMAQDFKHAFYPGRDDKGISTLEFDGVELAAIQGLNRKLTDQLNQKDAEIQNLQKQLDELEASVTQLAARK
jgi:hypothetical protein